MGRSRIGWALSVAAPWCMAFAVLLSITAEAEQEPYAGSAFDRNRMTGVSGPIDRAPRLPRAVDEDGLPLPIVEARLVVPAIPTPRRRKSNRTAS